MRITNEEKYQNFLLHIQYKSTCIFLYIIYTYICVYTYRYLKASTKKPDCYAYFNWLVPLTSTHNVGEMEINITLAYFVVDHIKPSSKQNWPYVLKAFYLYWG